MDGTTRPPPARRLTALFGTVAALSLVGAFFLPLWRVDAAEASRFAAALADEAESAAAADPLVADFVAAFQAVGDSGEIRPADLLHYARTAPHVREQIRDAQRARDERTGVGPLARRADETPSLLFDRVLTLLVLVVAGVPLGSALLVLYFVSHRFRRARSPGLILAFVVGTTGLLLPVAWRYVSLKMAPVVEAAPGLHVVALASAVLVLTALFGVSTRNWWRVYAGALLTTGSLALLAWAYCQIGGTA